MRTRILAGVSPADIMTRFNEIITAGSDYSNLVNTTVNAISNNPIVPMGANFLNNV